MPERPDKRALQAACDQGLALHQAGRLEDAWRQYSLVLAAEPDHVDALHRLGVLFIQTGQLDQAIALIRRAVEIQPRVAIAHGNLSNALNSLGRHDEALISADRAIALKPDFAEAHGNRGLALHQLGRTGEALKAYERVVKLKPDARAHYNRGVMLRELGRFEDAAVSFERAIGLKPDYAEAHYSRGVILRDLRRLEDSVASFDRALALRPGHAEAHFDRGLALRELNRWDEALAAYDQAIALKADYPEAYNNRGNVLGDLGRPEEALASYAQAIALKPDYADAYRNRGVALMDARRMDAAFADFGQAIVLRPDHAEAHYNMAIGRLMTGDFSAGWPLYEWRWRLGPRHLTPFGFAQPLWLGEESVAGKTLLLCGEQGLGDCLQFCRYAGLAADLGARVVQVVDRPLVEALRSLRGVDQVVAAGDPLPAFDLYCPLMSLPLALGGVIPSEPYLAADPAKVEAWRLQLGERWRPRVGLVWSGGFTPDQPERWALNGRRNISLERFAPLGQIDVDVYSLQKGQPAEGELSRLQAAGWPGPKIIDLTSQLKDFSDTSALIETLDLVIAVDTSTAHLAGALGKPVWILNRFDACWRWLTDRDDSPWYPSARLFRQSAPGDWSGPVEAVASALRALRAEA